MTTPEIVMWAIVAVLGLGGGIRLKRPPEWIGVRNPTALALAVSWLVGQVYYLRTGDGLATGEYFMADIAVITLIYAKTIWRVGPKSYPSAWLHLKCFFLDLTIWDRWIVVIFLLGSWPAYVIEIAPYYKYWLLYWLTASQFLCSGIEALASWRQRKSPPDEAPTADIIPFIPRFGAEPIPALRSATQLPTSGGGGVRC